MSVMPVFDSVLTGVGMALLLLLCTAIAADLMCVKLDEQSALLVPVIWALVVHTYWGIRRHTGTTLRIPIPENEGLLTSDNPWRKHPYWRFNPNGERVAWLRRNGIRRYTFLPSKTPTLWFARKDDAFAYKMRWL